MSNPVDEPGRGAGHVAHQPAQSRRSASGSDQYRMPEAQEILERVISIIDAAPGMPMSQSVRVNREELLELLNDRIRKVPGVASTETSIYLNLYKQTYQWGTR